MRDSNIVRFTTLIPVELHRRIKIACAASDTFLGDRIREILEREFGSEPERPTKPARVRQAAETAR